MSIKAQTTRRIKKLLKNRWKLESNINTTHYSSGGGGNIIDIIVYPSQEMSLAGLSTLRGELEAEVAGIYNPSIYITSIYITQRDKAEWV